MASWPRSKLRPVIAPSLTVATIETSLSGTLARSALLRAAPAPGIELANVSLKSPKKALRLVVIVKVSVPPEEARVTVTSLVSSDLNLSSRSWAWEESGFEDAIPPPRELDSDFRVASGNEIHLPCTSALTKPGSWPPALWICRNVSCCPIALRKSLRSACTYSVLSTNRMVKYALPLSDREMFAAPSPFDRPDIELRVLPLGAATWKLMAAPAIRFACCAVMSALLSWERTKSSSSLPLASSLRDVVSVDAWPSALTALLSSAAGLAPESLAAGFEVPPAELLPPQPVSSAAAAVKATTAVAERRNIGFPQMVKVQRPNERYSRLGYSRGQDRPISTW